eukprot:TRINITY_DN32368_c0_g1_i1.p1 TRINITY_DN32368_c0_g1~~TRINITY_DN32368_c0_g1_i1.p1  ORF type:complete len:557 (-),score=117.73 TRINITY_DN32368_c0_g1_i1:328-1998(-)
MALAAGQGQAHDMNRTGCTWRSWFQWSSDSPLCCGHIADAEVVNLAQVETCSPSPAPETAVSGLEVHETYLATKASSTSCRRDADCVGRTTGHEWRPGPRRHADDLVDPVTQTHRYKKPGDVRVASMESPTALGLVLGKKMPNEREPRTPGHTKHEPTEPEPEAEEEPERTQKLPGAKAAVKEAAEPAYCVAAARLPEDVDVEDLPIIVFDDDLTEQKIWRSGFVKKGSVCARKSEPDIKVPCPLMMSPAFLQFQLRPEQQRYVQCGDVGVVFQRPEGARFMQPSIDTMLMCHGLKKLFQQGGSSSSSGPKMQVTRAVDVGSGSGFIGKYLAAKAPGVGPLTMTLADIDTKAMTYCQSSSFDAFARRAGKFDCQEAEDREVSWEYAAGDALKLLENDSAFDLIVSNPPYIPTTGEVKGQRAKTPSGFWEGIGLVSYLIDMFAKRRPPKSSCLVMMITSLTLKAPGVRSALETAVKKGMKLEVLVEKEIAWKADYAGPTDGDFLLAKKDEMTKRRKIGGCDFFLGATKPGESREKTMARDYLKAYHWHVAYVVSLRW